MVVARGTYSHAIAPSGGAELLPFIGVSLRLSTLGLATQKQMVITTSAKSQRARMATGGQLFGSLFSIGMDGPLPSCPSVAMPTEQEQYVTKVMAPST